MNQFNKGTFMTNVPTAITGPQQKTLGAFAETITAQIGGIAAGVVAQPQGGVTLEHIVQDALALQCKINSLVLSTNWKGGAAY